MKPVESIRNFFGKSLYRKLLISSLFTLIFCLVLLGFLSFRSARNIVRNEVFRHNNQLVLLAAKDIHAHFNNIVHNFRLLASQMNSASTDPISSAKAMLEFRKAFPLTFKGIYMLDDDNQAIIHLADSMESLMNIKYIGSVIKRPMISVNKKLEKSAEAARQSGFYISPVYYRGIDKAPCLFMTHPLPSVLEGAVLGADIDLRSTWRRVDELWFGQGGKAFVVSAEGRIIAHPDRSYIGRQIVSELSPLLSGFAGDTEYTDPLSGERMLASYTPVGKQSGWGVVMEQVKSEELAPLKKIAGVAVSVLVFAIGLATILTLLISRNVVEPVYKLAEATEKITHTGDLGQRVEVTGKDEVSRLAQTFNQMVHSLKQTQDAVLSSEEKYRLVVEQSNDMIFIIQDGIIKFPNRKMIEITGYSKKELERINFVSFIHPEDRSQVMLRHRKRIMGEDAPVSYSFRILNKKNQAIWVHTNSALTTWESRTATLNVLRDMTDLRQLEDKLRQAHKMEAIGTLAGGIAHDFNNILGIIVGNAELAIDGLPEGEPVRNRLEKLLVAAFRGRDVVRQLLDFSRKSEEIRKPVDLAPIVNDSLKMLRSWVPAGIRFQTNIVGENHIIAGDPGQLHQVVINLATNSIHAMEEKGGVLIIELTNETVKPNPDSKHSNVLPGEYVRLSVSDTGTGIPSNQLDRIFDPYFTTKETGKGSGLGLAMVHGIVNSHSGIVNVKSDWGKGTVFRLYFPRIKEVPAVTDIGKGEFPGGRERILLIDDEPMMVNVYGLLLERLGYEVVSFTNPVEALHKFRSETDRIDLVITDMNMSEMNGSELLARLKEIRDDVKVILCSGYSEKMDEKRAKESGARSYLLKPLEREKLAATIRRILDAK